MVNTNDAAGPTGSTALRKRFRLRPDPFIVAILVAVGIACLLPAKGEAAHALSLITKLSIALLFFLHGARLSREAVVAGVGNWRLHLTVFSSTFVLFPLLGLAAAWLLRGSMPAGLVTGVIFLGCLPSTVQSSIAFTSIARGNVPAAVTSASFSNLIGIVVTPLLVGLLLRAHGAGFSIAQVEGVLLQLLAPFVLGQIARRWIGAWAKRNAKLLSFVDRGSVVLIVYVAFSEAVVGGILRQVSALQLVAVLALSATLLGIVITTTALGSRKLGFSKQDEITIVFCGSKKSLATGVPMAGILFPAASVGLIVLPLMIFHQLQLMICAILAQKYGSRRETT